MSSRRPRWYSSMKLNESVQDFHNEYARTSTTEIKEARKYMCYLVENHIEPYLKAEGLCDRVEFAGSCSQGIRVNNGELEFDLVFILNTGVFNVRPDQHEDRPGYFLLTCNSSCTPAYVCHYDDGYESTGFICGKALKEHFLKNLCSLRKNNREMTKRIKFQRHGPAIRMDVRRADGSKWFVVDLVPTYEEESAEYGNVMRWVGKPYKSRTEEGGIHKYTWYRSFALEETKIFRGWSNGNDPRKKIQRVLKMLVFHDDELRQEISSYVLKTVLLNYIERYPDAIWNDEKLGLRLMGLVGYLKVALENEWLEHHFIGGDDLFKDVETEALHHMADIIRQLHQDPDVMFQQLAIDDEDYWIEKTNSWLWIFIIRWQFNALDLKYIWNVITLIL